MLTCSDLKKFKNKRKFSMLTCYDFPTAKIIDQSKIDVVLVGDSLGEVIYGFPNTTYVDMRLMENHVLAVRKGLKNIHLMVDLPYSSYNTPSDALKNAKTFIYLKAQSIKLEIPTKGCCDILVKNNINFCAHIGLTPQTIHDYKKQGKTPEKAQIIFEQALDYEKWGAFCVLVEAIPEHLAQKITKELNIPVIGIASGRKTDAQVLVLHDMLGYSPQERSYAKKQASVYHSFLEAFNNYHQHVISDI